MSAESEVSNWKYSHFLKNESSNFSKNDIFNILSKQDIDEAYKVISRWDNYSPTPLITLSKLSKITQLPNVLVKRRIKYTSFETEQFNTSVGIMHSNIKTFLQKNIPLHHCKLLRFIKYSPLKNREEYNIAFTLLLELKNTYLTDKNLDDETIRLIETDVNKIIDKWKKYPNYHKRFKHLQICENIF